MAPAADTAAAPAKNNKRRAPMSCDRCKSRKTKCVDPVPGPCQFCASISAVCHLDPSRRRQRPYYHVSEEEFRYMTKALEHFLPNTDLNLQSLREVVQALEAGQPIPGRATESSPAQSSQSQSAYKYNISMPMTLPLTAPPSEGSTSSGDSIVVGEGDRTTPAANKTEDASLMVVDTTTSIDEIDELHGELGWLRVDSRGTYRHVGADSGYGFHAAVRSLRQRRESDVPSKTDIVPPFTIAPPLPPSTPDSGAPVPSPNNQPYSLVGLGTGRRMQIFLPRRDLCNRCVSRFFRDIQSVYWFWSAERFYAVLDRLYAGDPSSATPAMLCSLYSILALTCESEAQQAQQQVNVQQTLALSMAGVAGVPPDPSTTPPPAARYLALAKGLVSALCDEADTDSVRALCLLGLALQSNMFNNTAYIYIGAAARIALTLGLHLPRAIEPKGCLQRQIDLRLYSTLFLLDLDIALCYGNPPAISDEHATAGSGGKPHDLSEQILSPGSHMPLDYLTVSCELAQIRRRLSKLLYVRGTAAAAAPPTGATGRSGAAGATASATAPNAVASPPASSPPSSSNAASSSFPSSSSSSSPKPSIAAVSDVLATLRAWYAAIPPHLRDVSRAASFHQRSVSVLHLRYWSATIFATRPFLLYSALHAEAFATLPAAKRASFEAFCTTCLDAAKQSLAVMGIMQDAGLLSSLITLDTGCILEILQVFLLALARCNSSSGSGFADAENVRACLRTLQGMEQIFWTNHACLEVMAQLDENGLLNGDNNFSPPQGETPGNFFLDIHQQQHQQQQQQQQLLMEAYFSDLQDPFFAVNEDGTASMLSDHFQESMHSGLTL
ncbi:hypothetical protein SEUCBS139899_003177 [Sporothrix eucalyptigena]|uniref:Zn(2)-C6 fungal-type domain-containing protein n=1 Tax=Sporothrix eucalyptigena TaxID=1812306 RepID=A0ABP0AZN5_9PEZI